MHLVNLLSLLPLFQVALADKQFRRIIGSSHSIYVNDLMHMVCPSVLFMPRGGGHHSTCAVHVVVCMQFHSGIGERLFDMRDAIFRRHYEELNADASARAMAIFANQQMGDLDFRWVWCLLFHETTYILQHWPLSGLGADLGQ